MTHNGTEFIQVVIVVDDMLFASNSRRMLEEFKDRLKESFEVKFFPEVTSFIGW